MLNAKSFISLIMALCLIISHPSSIYALTKEQKKLYDSGILYYDLESQSNNCSTDSGSLQMNGDDAIATVFNFLVNKGLTDFQAAGVLGNMHHESGYQPQRLQGTKSGTITRAEDVPRNQTAKAYGLVQWDKAHKMIDPVTAAGKDPNDIYAQLEFLWAQLNNQWPEGWSGSTPTDGFNEKRAGDHLKTTTNVAEATLSFETKYERHKGEPQSSRITEAQRILDLATSNAFPTDTSGSAANLTGNCSNGASLNTGDVVTTATTYAWPTYRGNDINTRPEYTQAVQKAMSEGRYVGGINHKGIDCGGFVTTVMIDSGFEPAYNTNGKGGDTVAQKTWAQNNWQQISVSSTADLQPGDVAFTPGHTFLYVGDVPGFESNVASASLDKRAPMAGKEGILKDHNGVSVVWFRKV